MATGNELTPSEERLFRTLARKKAVDGISAEELKLFEAFQQRRLEAIESACHQESTTARADSAAAIDAYERVIEALKDYVEVVKSENSAWSTAEGKA